MLKQTTIATIVVFIVWSVLDFVIHSILLQSIYEQTAYLWRAVEEMNMPLMSLVTFVFAACFVSIYSYFINPKSVAIAIKYAAVFGLATSMTMGFGSYAYMPIPMSLAINWFVGNFVEIMIAGFIIGVFVKPSDRR